MAGEHLMIDLETLDTTDSSYVLSIGACVFGPEAGQPDLGHFYTSVKGEQPMRTVSRSTLDWWMSSPRVSSAARTVFTDQTAVGLFEAMGRFLHWIETQAPLFYWANDPDFDVDILKHTCAQYGLKWPGRYNSGRSFRTITHHAFGYDGEGRPLTRNWPERRPDLVEHHALHDAIYEAQVACAAWQKIGGV